MDVNTLARLSGITPDSVLDCKQLKGGHVFRIDARRDAEASGKNHEFQTDFILDGASRPFVPGGVERKRSTDWGTDPGRATFPSWRVLARVYPQASAYGAEIETLSFLTFEVQEGTYDLSVDSENNPLARPTLMYSLARMVDGIRISIHAFAHAGMIEVHHELQAPNLMRLSAAFSGVKFLMPNSHELFEQAPDREFEVQLPSGFYELFGSW